MAPLPKRPRGRPPWQAAPPKRKAFAAEFAAPLPRASAALCLPTPDWLAHRLWVAGPAALLSAFRAAAAGPGVIPWPLRASELEEGWFGQLVAPPPGRRGISVEGAHVLAGQLAAAAQALQAQAQPSLVPLDLHALLPVPPAVLRLGPDAPEADAWLWEHWGTTWPLRGVAEDAPGAGEQGRPAEARTAACFRFHSADWSPWRALASLRVRWPGLCFDLRPDYGFAEPGAPAARAPRRGGRVRHGPGAP